MTDCTERFRENWCEVCGGVFNTCKSCQHDRQTALAWLNQFTATAGFAYQVRVIKAMLAEPRMPECPQVRGPEIMAMWKAADARNVVIDFNVLNSMYDALRSALSASGQGGKT